MSFLTIAQPLAERGIPITPVRPGTKQAFLPDFPTTATTDLAQINEWNRLYSDHNAACVARAEIGGVWFWETDSTEVRDRVLNDTGRDINIALATTFRVRSRPGRGHYYFRHTAASIALGNISQTYVIGGDWSVRTHHQYVVAPGSAHPDTGQLYQALNWAAPIEEAPDWLIKWLLSQKVSKPASSGNGDAPATGQKIQHGKIHGFMLTQAGKLRAMGLDQPEIEVALLKIVHDQCEPPIDDAKVIQMSKSICNFAPGDPNAGKALKFNQSAADEQPKLVEPVDVGPQAVYPVFPEWVMYGTSIYEGYVKPYCAQNERISYFMWMPAAAMMLNYLGTKVSVPLKDWKPSLYIVLIGEKGRAHKSASIKDAMKYMEFAHLLQEYSAEIKNADGKSIVMEAGSPEGLGLDIQRISCKNIVLFYDELSALVTKAGYDGSGMNSMMLKLYESARFANSVKRKKEAFNVAADSYCATIITATTTEKFPELWSLLAGQDTGLNDRFTFVMQPETMPAGSIHEAVPFNDAALRTRELINKAVQQKHFKFYDQAPFQLAAQLYGGRAQIRAEKWALYFAVDLGLDEIDEDCVERGIALARYEHEVKEHLGAEDAEDKYVALEQLMVQTLERNRGRVPEFGPKGFRAITKERKHGVRMWNGAFQGLKNAGVLGQNSGDIVLLRKWGG